MSGDHNINQTDPGWRKRQIALDKKAENARELGLDYNKTIMEMAREAGLAGKPMFKDGLEAFAALVRADERDRIYAEQFELPEPRLTGKFSITAGKFKCTGCTGTWTDREDAKHHFCKDYQ